MWFERQRARPKGWGMSRDVDEIVDSVLDAADLDILEEMGDRRTDGPLLLRELMIDILRRYRTRRRRQEAIRARKEVDHG